MVESYPNGKKTLWEREKFLFSHSVFKRLNYRHVKTRDCFGNGLIIFQTVSVWKSLEFVVWERVKPFTRSQHCSLQDSSLKAFADSSFMAVCDARVSWLSHASTNTTFFPKPTTTFLTCFRKERQKCDGKKVYLNLILFTT